MTTSLTPIDSGSLSVPTSSADPFAGLTPTDAPRIEAAMSVALADSTRTVYAHAWRAWERWCATRQITPLPATSAAVCAYLTERAGQGASVAVLDVACSAISYIHRSQGFGDPVVHEAVRLVGRGLRRTLGAAPRRPSTSARRGRDPPDRHRHRPRHPQGRPGRRDHPSRLRLRAAPPELTGLTLADIETRPGGLLLMVRRSKTDPEGHGQVVGVAHGQHALTEPAAALAAWTAVRGRAPGPLFTSLRHWSSPMNRSPAKR
jgi:hypothetical protein